MAKERPGVMVYFDLEPALKLLDDSQRGKLFSGILEYGHYGVVPEFDDDLLDMAWSFVKASIDRDGDRYNKSVQKKKIAGITSDFKTNYAPKHGIDPEDKNALQDYISQRLLASADECQPTTTSTTAPTPTTTPITASIPTPTSKAETTGEGGGRRLSAEDFEQRRQKQIALLREKVP